MPDEEFDFDALSAFEREAYLNKAAYLVQRRYVEAQAELIDLSDDLFIVARKIYESELKRKNSK